MFGFAVLTHSMRFRMVITINSKTVFQLLASLMLFTFHGSNVSNVSIVGDIIQFGGQYEISACGGCCLFLPFKQLVAYLF